MKLYAAAQLFRGLADPTRLRILNVLAQAGKMNGSVIADLLVVPRARVARHLRYLYRSRLVVTERRNRETLYGLRSEDDPVHRAVRRMTDRLLIGLDGMGKDNQKVRRTR